MTLSDSNIISGNARAGLRISGSGTTNNTVRANKIGTLADTAIAVGNAIGVWITSGAKANQIGEANARNIISVTLHSVYPSQASELKTMLLSRTLSALLKTV